MRVIVQNCFLNSNVGPASWRVFCTNNFGGSSFIEIGEVQFLNSVGDVIPTTGGTVIYSSAALGNNPADAFDGNVTTSWVANSTVNEWIGYEFPSGHNVDKVVLTVRNGGANPIGRFPQDCKLQYYDIDTATWTDSITFTTALPVQGASQTFPYVAPPAGYHRAWRLFCVDNNGGSSFIELDALEFRATSGGADQTDGANDSFLGNTLGRTIESSHATASEAYHAFDDSGTFWLSNGTTNQYAGYVFPEAVKFEELLITIANTGSNPTGRAPKNMKIEYSDDGESGTTWTTQKTLAAQTGWSLGETRVLAAI